MSMSSNYSDDRWVLLGGMICMINGNGAFNGGVEKVSFWMSDLMEDRVDLKDLFEENSNNATIMALKNMCDGRRYDAYVEFIDLNEEEDLMLTFDSENKENDYIEFFGYVRIKIYFWLNFSAKILTKYNCNKGILSITNSIVSYDLIYHLKSTLKLKEIYKNRPESLFDFFKRSILELEILRDNSYLVKNEMKGLYSCCSVLNCLDHLNFKDDFDAKTLNMGILIDYLGNEISNSFESKNKRIETMDDILKFVIRNYDNVYEFDNVSSSFNYFNGFKFVVDNLPIDILFKIMDYLDVNTRISLGTVNRRMYYIWLVYYSNLLLPHQRKSVSLLLKRENSINNQNVYDENWFYNNQIKFTTSSEDHFKYLSMWHYLYIRSMEGIVNNEYLEDIVWFCENDVFKNFINNENKVISSYLKGLIIHPKELDYDVSCKIFSENNTNFSNLCLYFDHINKNIHLGYKFSDLDINEKYIRTNGGILCDEPGLGKTLTVLSLIEKTSNNESNVDIDFIKMNIIKYPKGVYNFRDDINKGIICFIFDNEKINMNLIEENNKKNSIKNYSSEENYNHNKTRLISSKSTLIIVPNHLVQHWINEIEKWYGKDNIEINSDNFELKRIKKNSNIKKFMIQKCNNLYCKLNYMENQKFPKCYVYDDSSCNTMAESKIIADSDIVIVSYRMLTKQYQLCKIKREYKRAFLKQYNKEIASNMDLNEKIKENDLFDEKKSPLLGIKWYRLVVDEGHNVGNSGITSKLYQQFIVKIRSEYRWIMSGTPLSVSFIKSINLGISNALNFLELPIIYNKFETEKLGRNTYKNNNSLLSLISKSVHNGNKLVNPISLFALITQLGSLLVYNNKRMCLSNYLPKLLGPYKRSIKPFINNEFFMYNMLMELTQRNLFCTYYSENNIDSLLHSSNVSFRQEVIWNLRFSSILGFTLNLRNYMMDDNKLELIKSMNFSIPSIYVSESNIIELRQMLENSHELYENEYYYKPESLLRLDFVLNYFTNIKLVNNINTEYENKIEFQDNFCYYKCDSCCNTVMFPLIIPCPKIHMVCVHCIMYGLGYKPIKIDFSDTINKHNHKSQIYNNYDQNKGKYIWPQRGKVEYCVICGPKIRINSDFFDRLQIPIEINHNNTNYNKINNNIQVPNRYVKLYGNQKAIRNKDKIYFNNSINENNMIISNLNIIIELKHALINDYKSSKINVILEKLYELFNDITIININNYLLNYINIHSNNIKDNSNNTNLTTFNMETSTNSSSFLEFQNRNNRVNNTSIIEKAYLYIPQVSIGLISFSSSKLRYIIHCILVDLEKDPSSKIMIVSNFWQQLDFIYYTLFIIFNIGTCRYYPHTPKDELLNTIDNFKLNNKHLSVLLLSVELGSHGLDLSCVSKMYILDPIVDESIENQTISRAYRIRSNPKNLYGLNNNYVQVIYCFVENTFEDLLYDYIIYMRRCHSRNDYCVDIKKDSDESTISNSTISNTYIYIQDALKHKACSNILSNNKKRRQNTSSISNKPKKQKVMLNSHGGNAHLRNSKIDKSNINKHHIVNNTNVEFVLHNIDPTSLLLRMFVK